MHGRLDNREPLLFWVRCPGRTVQAAPEGDALPARRVPGQPGDAGAAPRGRAARTGRRSALGSMGATGAAGGVSGDDEGALGLPLGTMRRKPRPPGISRAVVAGWRK